MSNVYRKLDFTHKKFFQSVAWWRSGKNGCLLNRRWWVRIQLRASFNAMNKISNSALYHHIAFKVPSHTHLQRGNMKKRKIYCRYLKGCNWFKAPCSGCTGGTQDS